VRGSIDHVGSGKRLYFHDLNGIVRLFRSTWAYIAAIIAKLEILAEQSQT